MSEAVLIKYATGVLVVVAAVLGAYVTRVRLRHTDDSRMVNKVSLHALHVLSLCVLVLALRQYAIHMVHDLGMPSVSDQIVDLSTVAIIALIVVLQVFLLIDLMEHRQIRLGNDPTTARLIARTFKIVVVVVVVLLFGEKLGFSVSGLLAFGGVGGIIIGMASKDVLSNFLSGIMLFFNRQFNIGDWISSPDRDIEGTVVEIGWRITKIMTFDHRPLYVPNSLFSSISVENPGRMTHRRIKATISLRYEDAGRIRGVVDDIRDMLLHDEKIDQSQTLLVYFDAFASSSLDILVYCFTRTTHWAQWLEAQQDVFLNIIDIVHRHGADLAFDTQTLYVADASGDPQPAGPAARLSPSVE
ncbi:mechanosensitive ion channel family protein [Castellaniella sp.]|uniref:mechanosensitive ion channel family protein n=1 Tax=Castellaniella sp. TaxID=1955812 RepID=UPI00356AF0C3